MTRPLRAGSSVNQNRANTHDQEDAPAGATNVEGPMIRAIACCLPLVLMACIPSPISIGDNNPGADKSDLAGTSPEAGAALRLLSGDVNGDGRIDLLAAP